MVGGQAQQMAISIAHTLGAKDVDAMERRLVSGRILTQVSCNNTGTASSPNSWTSA